MLMCACSAGLCLAQCEPRGAEAAGPMEPSLGAAGDKGAALAPREAFEWDPSSGHDEFFCDSYLADLNGAMGARRLGFAAQPSVWSAQMPLKRESEPRGRGGSARGSMTASRHER